MNVTPLSAGNSGQKLKFYINRNKRLKKCLEQENEPPQKAVILQTLIIDNYNVQKTYIKAQLWMM